MPFKLFLADPRQAVQPSASTTHDIVGKLWNLCNVFKDDGVGDHQDVTGGGTGWPRSPAAVVLIPPTPLTTRESAYAGFSVVPGGDGTRV